MLTKRNYTMPGSGCVQIVLPNDHIALIDKEDKDRICNYTWKLRHGRGCTYAVRKKVTNRKEFLVAMHRQIMHCPTDKVVHHINHNGLDNRKANLIIMTKDQHHELHRFN